MSNHVAYLKYWLRAMKADSGFILKAAGQASRSADYILGFSRPTSVVQPEGEALMAG